MGETLGILLPVIQLLAKTPVVNSDSPVTDLILEQNKPKAFPGLQAAVPQPPFDACVWCLPCHCKYVISNRIK